MKIRWLLLIILILSFLLALAGGYEMLWRFFVFVVAVLFLSYLWLRFSIRRIEGRADNLPRFCRVGEQFEEEFVFNNRGPLPTAMIEARQDTDLPGYRDFTTFHLTAQGTYKWRTRVNCTLRGEYSLGNITARITDPLGLISLKRGLGYGQYLTVFPATIDVPYFQALPHQEPGLSPRSWFSSQTTNASRVREYAHGDSLRYIHWQSTAHTGNLMVKEFDPDHLNYSYKDIWIILDMQHASQFGQGAESTTEYGVTIAASLAKKYLENGKKVGLLASGDKSYLHLPETGQEQIESMMRSLAIIKPGGEVPVVELLISQEERFDIGSAVIVITSSDIKKTGPALRRIVRRGTIVTAIILDAISFDGNISGVETARGLVSSGVHAYIVRKGVDITRALDSRFVSSPMQDTGVKDRSER